MNRSALVVVVLAGCAQFRPPVEDSSSGGGGEVGALGHAPGGSCGKRAQIEDGEDDDGSLYTFADSHGTKIAPGDDFTFARGGANGSHASMRIKGTLAKASEVYAGLGLDLREPKAPLDASSFTGVAFTAKRSAKSTAYLRFQIADVNTDPDAKVCTECDNDFGIPLEVTEEWTRYEVKFADLAQEDGWGAPRPPALDTTKLYALQWQVAVSGADFDVSIDDVTFIGCGDENRHGSD
jgi:hypothetical protein